MKIKNIRIVVWQKFFQDTGILKMTTVHVQCLQQGKFLRAHRQGKILEALRGVWPWVFALALGFRLLIL